MALIETKTITCSSSYGDDDYSSVFDEGGSGILDHHHPPLVSTYNDRYVGQLNKLPRKMTSVAEAMTAFMRIVSSVKESLKKVLMRGEFDEYQDVKSMHCTARLSEMLSDYCAILHTTADIKYGEHFLIEEIKGLEEAKGIGLPNFLPRPAFLAVLNKKVNEISSLPIEFVEKLWRYMEQVLINVMIFHLENYPMLQSSMRRAAHNLIVKMKDASVNRVMELVEMERLTDYTCDPQYIEIWNKLIAHENSFMELVIDHSKPVKIKIEWLNEVEVGHLRLYGADVVRQAFDMKMRMIAYWKIVLKRMVDCMALHVLYSIHNLVNRDIETEIVSELMAPHGGGIERMLEESPALAGKREKLNRSIKLLRESKEVVGNVMDQIAAYGD
ncbi:Dynamin [Cynara cardunculus var. scolymus]|uniref:Dynamin n=1 Tax=Cynara cardunculus var. scolymus TaxID=59895 RepID=A0A103YHP7_CYNCS|nr:Dynamin [Cynara cardunculus var. scolymus]